MRKSLFILFFLLLHNYFCIAQDDNQNDRDIEAVRTAYITNQLKLTPQEAQQFWPVYNNYIQEIKAARKESSNDIVAQQEKIVNIRKKYKGDFKRVIGSDDRVNKAFTVEGEFRKMLMNEIHNRHPNTNRQFLPQFDEKSDNS